MAYAKTNDELSEVRAIIAIRAKRADGAAKAATTRAGRAYERQQRDQETEAQIMSTALAQPHRKALPPHRISEEGRRIEIQRRDPLGGSAIGRLFLHGTITRDQLIAAQRYTELALRHMHHITGHLPKFPSQAINDTIKGLDCSADMSDDEVFNLRRSFQDAQTALADTNEWQGCSAALMSVCIMDRETRSEKEIGSLRIGLNALHRLWA